jgi:hypothetical protein
MPTARFRLLKSFGQSRFNAIKVTAEGPCELVDRKVLTGRLPRKIGYEIDLMGSIL